MRILIAFLFFTHISQLALAGTFYVLSDHRGAPVKVIDINNIVVWEADYDPFEKATVNEDPDGDGINFEQNIRLPGQYYDKETGLHYNNRRYYDPDTGRYITSDPIGIDGGMNTYLYANANPVRFSDRTGLAPGDLFASDGDAAIDAGNFARTKPNQFIEYGGWIYPVGQCWTYNLGSGNHFGMPNELMERLRPGNPTAAWHTHPLVDGRPDFSDGDKNWSAINGPLYLNTPTGENLLYSNGFSLPLPQGDPVKCDNNCQ